MASWPQTSSFSFERDFSLTTFIFRFISPKNEKNLDHNSDIRFSTPVRNTVPSPDGGVLSSTPFRTPKNIRGKKVLDDSDRILGTYTYGHNFHNFDNFIIKT